jgi:hypothetical protein
VSATQPTYSADVRPKFRPQDINCMARHHVKLNDATWMCDATPGNGFADHGNARLVYSKLSSGDMPPDGPWPADWLTTYQNWMTAGFQP